VASAFVPHTGSVPEFPGCFEGSLLTFSV
jgi:hypothetical protein